MVDRNLDAFCDPSGFEQTYLPPLQRAAGLALRRCGLPAHGDAVDDLVGLMVLTLEGRRCIDVGGGEFRIAPRKGKSTLDAFLARVALNLVRDGLRSKARSTKHKTEEAGDTVATRLPDPSEAAEHAEQQSTIHGAINSLPEKLRQIVLAKCDGLTSDEIGRALGLPASTVRTRLATAVESLSRRLQQLNAA